jgi:glycosyltransferase involved in cell wall biosynthesis
MSRQVHFAEVSPLPLVSVVIPCFRGEQFLSEAIESCLKQTYRNLEILIVDDASPDASAAVAERFMGRYSNIRLLRHSVNRGVSAAWNTGMEASTGEYILRLAQDDTLEPDAISKMVETFQQRPSPSVVYADCNRCSPDGAVTTRPTAPPDALFRSAFNIGVCVMISRAIVDDGYRYNPSIRAAEDLEFFTRVFDAGYRFARCETNPLLNFRVHPEAGTATNYVRQQWEAGLVLSRRERSLVGKWRMWSRYLPMAVFHLRKQRQWGAALRLCGWSLLKAPFCLSLWKQLVAVVLRIPPSTT